MQNFAEQVARFARAVEQRDGAAFAALFTPHALYHDAIYGAVHGREAIAKMMVDDWYRDGDRWIWDMHEPVCDAERGYARYVASFTSLNRFSSGQRIVARGVAIFGIEGGGCLAATTRSPMARRRCGIYRCVASISSVW